MKYAIPEISWHNRDPVLSVDFQPKCAEGEPLRLASGGTDSHVLIWHVKTLESGSVNLEVAADLTRHQKAVNVVRWSPSGQYLASGDDESIVFVWKQNMDKELATPLEQIDDDKESWTIYKTLRGHMEDVLDLSWSPDSLYLASGSVDNKLIVWDVTKGKYSSILSDHKGFVQGVAWDPKNQMIATASSDRVFRTFEVSSKKVRARSSKAVLPAPPAHPLHNASVRLYHDDTLQTFYRRVSWSPDGALVAAPGGRADPEQGAAKPLHAAYIYTRDHTNIPACVIPCNTTPLVTRWSPVQYAPRSTPTATPSSTTTATPTPTATTTGSPTATPAGPCIPLPRRLVLAVGTRAELLLYDTHQRTPLALISNIHYTRLTDLTWSPDGSMLVASSTDGFCSVITFSPGELGEAMSEDIVEKAASAEDIAVTGPMEVDNAKIETQKTKTVEPKEKSTNKKTIDSFMKFKSPNGDKTKAESKTLVKIDVLEEVAMPSWSDNSQTDIIKPKHTPQSSAIIEIEDSEDIKLVYEETEGNKSTESIGMKSPLKTLTEKEAKTPENVLQSPKGVKRSAEFMKQAKVIDVTEGVANKVVPSPKAPRRVSFVTLSSPKNSKKKC